MTVLNLSNLHIQLDWPEGTKPTPDQLADMHKWFNEALFKLSGEPCVMGEASTWTVEVAHDDVVDLDEIGAFVDAELVALGMGPDES